MSKGIDEKCWDLAEHFFRGERPAEGKTAELAQAIQDAVDEWFSDNDPYSDPDEHRLTKRELGLGEYR